VTLTPAERNLRNISEAQFQETVTDLATLWGWWYYHSPKNRPVNGRVQRITAGFPDLVLIWPPRILFAELKSQTGKARPEQLLCLARLAEAGQETYLWRPSDLALVKATLAPERGVA
jgi:hypothetical protein